MFQGYLGKLETFFKWWEFQMWAFFDKIHVALFKRKTKMFNANNKKTNIINTYNKLVVGLAIGPPGIICTVKPLCARIGRQSTDSFLVFDPKDCSQKFIAQPESWVHLSIFS